MRKLSLSLLVILFYLGNPTFLKSQQWIIDSLEQELPNAKPGIDEIDYLLGLTRAYMFARTDKEKNLALTDEVIEKSRAIGYVDGEIYANSFKGMILIWTEEGNNYLQKAFNLAKKEGSKDALLFAAYIWGNFVAETDQMAVDTLLPILLNSDETVTRKNIAQSHHAMGGYYLGLGQMENALKHLDQARELFELTQIAPEINPILGRVSALDADKGLENLAQVLDKYRRVYFYNSQPNKALEYGEKALTVIRKSKDPSSIGYYLSNLAALERELGHYEKALQLLTEADSLNRVVGDQRNIISIQRSFGRIYDLMGDYDLAEAAYLKGYEASLATTQKGYLELDRLIDLYIKTNQLDKAELRLKEIFPQNPNDKKTSVVYLNKKGALQFKKGQYDLAIQSLQEANDHSKNIPNIAQNNLLISKAYAALNQFDKASLIATKALASFSELGDANGIKDNYLNLSEIYEKAGSPIKALNTYKKYHLYSDSLYTADAQAKLKEEQVRQNIFAFEEEKEAAEKEAALLSTQNKLYLALAAALLGILLIGGYLYAQLRKTRKKLEVQNDQLQQLNQTKDKFFGIIAHDIRSPIVALDGVGKQMNFYLKKEKFDKLLKISDLVDSTAKRLNSLLDNLLNWALLQTGTIPYHPKEISLNQTAADIFAIFNPLANLKNIELVNNIQNDLTVYADESALNAIIRNLISNALKFTPEGGTITVDTQEAGDKVEIMINDTGTGIDAERLKKMFTLERKSTKGTKGEKGTGLGLILCKELVELNQGAIKVESEVGKGTKFTFSVPIAA